MLLFSLGGCLFTYAILRLQQILPLNPQGLGPSQRTSGLQYLDQFTTNTNWQSYVGESTMSYLSQMWDSRSTIRIRGDGYRDRRSARAGRRPAFGQTIGNFWLT